MKYAPILLLLGLAAWGPLGFLLALGYTAGVFYLLGNKP